MSAHETYSLLVGEVGIDRTTFLYELPLWEINCIIKGHRRRYRDVWESARWQSFVWLNARGAKGIQDLQDLITFPWEKARDETPDEEEVNELRERIRAMNARMEDGGADAPCTGAGTPKT